MSFLVNKSKNIKSKKKDIEFEEILLKFKIDVNSTITIVIVFSVLTAILRLVFGAPIPIQVSILLFIWFSLYFLFWRHLLESRKTIDEIYNLYSCYNAVDFLLLTFIVHYLGSSGWIGIVFYLITLVLSGLLLPKKRTMILAVIASLSYTCLLVLEFFGIVAHNPLFRGTDLHHSFSFLMTNVIITTAIFYFLADSVGVFSEMLRKRQKQLLMEKQKVVKAYKKIEDSKKVLEVRVKARTKELKELTEKQEDLIKSRTRELTQKVKELQSFQKIAVGRELKMVELKKKIKELKGK